MCAITSNMPTLLCVDCWILYISPPSQTVFFFITPRGNILEKNSNIFQEAEQLYCICSRLILHFGSQWSRSLCLLLNFIAFYILSQVTSRTSSPFNINHGSKTQEGSARGQARKVQGQCGEEIRDQVQKGALEEEGGMQSEPRPSIEVGTLTCSYLLVSRSA